MEKKSAVEKKIITKATNKPASKTASSGIAPGVAPSIAPTIPATQQFADADPQLTTIITNMLNSLPVDQRMIIARALMSQSPLPPASQEKVKADVDQNAEAAKKALATADEAFKVTRATYSALLARKATHDQQIGALNTEKAELVTTEKNLQKSIQEFTKALTAHETVLASNILEASQIFQHNLHALDDIQRKLERCNQRLYNLEKVGEQITAEIGSAHEALGRADLTFRATQANVFANYSEVPTKY